MTTTRTEDTTRIVRTFTKADCDGGCGRRLFVDDPDEIPVCRDCGIAAMEAKHGGDWDSYR